MRLSRLSGLLLCLQVVASSAQQASITSVEAVREMLPVENQEPIKCGTGALHDWRKAESLRKSARLLMRPTLPESYATSDGLFRIHYATAGSDAVDPASTNNAGVPDYIYEVGLAATYSHRLLVDTLGYRSPADDAGRDGAEFDIFVVNLDRGYYGYTDQDTEVDGFLNRSIAYVVIDNNFLASEGYYTTGLDAMRVTVAHEYFHAVQFNYSNHLEDRFFFETSSVWFEDVAYTEVDDYLGYLAPYFRDVSQPLDLQNGQHEYGNGIWFKYLVKKFDINIVRQFWELMEAPAALETMNKVLVSRGFTLGAAYAEFASWLYFTKHRADPVRYFPEGASYPAVRINRRQAVQPSITITDSLTNLASRFYRFDSLRQALTVSQNASVQPGRWKFAAITGNPQDGFGVQQSSGGVPITVRPSGGVDTLVVVVSNSSLPTLEYDYKYSLQLASGTAAGGDRLLAPAPNPFVAGSGDNLLVRITLESSSEIDLFVIAEDGRRVRHISRSLRGPGIDEIPWDGRNDDGELVASGIYVVQVIAGGFQEAAKVAVVHR